MTKAASYTPDLLGKIPHRSSLSEARGGADCLWSTWPIRHYILMFGTETLCYL